MEFIRVRQWVPVCRISTAYHPSGTGQPRVNDAAVNGVADRLCVAEYCGGALTMTTITRVKLSFVVIGLALFIVGVWQDDARWRYAAIGCIAVAWVMRFFRQRTP
jgi:hypothetical protein